MGRTPCCDKSTVKKGPWSPEEDAKLKDYMGRNGTVGNWISLPPKAGLKRCGKSCRLRWLNYLRPNIKHGDFTEGEDQLICNLFASMGSRWSVIAAHLPGRTDNDIKNYWNTKLKKKFLSMAASPPHPPPPPQYHGYPFVFSSSSSNPPSSSSSLSSPLSPSSSLSQNTTTTYFTPKSPFTALEPINNISQNHHLSSFLSRNPNSHLDIHEQGSLVNSGEVCLEVNQSNGLLWSGSGTVTTGDLDQSSGMDYGSLEEIKKLICSTSTGSSCNHLLFGENKTEEKFMLYY